MTRARHFVQVATAAGGASALFRVRCERGAAIASSLGFPDATANAIRCLDEHWDGQGQPARMAGEEIPLLGRIACLALTLEVFVHDRGADRALAVMERRSGTWFDPALVAVVRTWKTDAQWWRLLHSDIAPARILAVADIYEALIADRPYRQGMPVERALEILRTGSGVGVDPEVVEALRRCLK